MPLPKPYRCAAVVSRGWAKASSCHFQSLIVVQPYSVPWLGAGLIMPLPKPYRCAAVVSRGWAKASSYHFQSLFVVQPYCPAVGPRPHHATSKALSLCSRSVPWLGEGLIIPLPKPYRCAAVVSRGWAKASSCHFQSLIVVQPYSVPWLGAGLIMPLPKPYRRATVVSRGPVGEGLIMPLPKPYRRATVVSRGWAKASSCHFQSLIVVQP